MQIYIFTVIAIIITATGIFIFLRICLKLETPDQIPENDLNETSTRLINTKRLSAPFVGIQEIRPELLTLLKSGAALSPTRKHQLLRSMVGALSPFERGEIYKYIQNNENNAASLALKNDLISILTKQKPEPEELCSELISIYYDFSLNTTLRSYAVKHLRTCYKHARDAEKEQIRQILDEAIEMVDSEIAGHALAVLSSLSLEFNEISSKKATKAAVKILADENATADNKVIALTVSGEQQFEDILPTARKMASSENIPEIIRIAALTAIAKLGDTTDRVLLIKLSSSPDKNIASAAKKSLEELRSKKV